MSDSLQETHLEKYGLSLHRLGYKIIPISAGAKAPVGMRDWQNIVADENAIIGWTTKFSGCGILSAHTIGVDIDCRKEDLTKYMLDFIRKKLGHVPHRVGMSPKALLPYRCEQPFSKVKSKEFFSPDGQKHMLEVLAKGQQFVASHIHPDTGNPYVWHYADDKIEEALTLPWADLPTMTEADAKIIVSEFEAQCRSRGWFHQIQHSRKERHPAFRSHRNARKYTEEDALSMLSFLNPDMPYENWLHVGMALHHGGFPVDFWDEWSKKSSKYKEGECQRKWQSFRDEVQA